MHHIWARAGFDKAEWSVRAGFNIRAVAPVAVTGVSAMASGKSGGDNADLVSVLHADYRGPADRIAAAAPRCQPALLQMQSNAIHLTLLKNEETKTTSRRRIENKCKAKGSFEGKHNVNQKAKLLKMQ